MKSSRAPWWKVAVPRLWWQEHVTLRRGTELLLGATERGPGVRKDR